MIFRKPLSKPWYRFCQVQGIEEHLCWGITDVMRCSAKKCGKRIFQHSEPFFPNMSSRKIVILISLFFVLCFQLLHLQILYGCDVDDEKRQVTQRAERESMSLKAFGACFRNFWTAAWVFLGSYLFRLLYPLYLTVSN